jgi:hypothetical protein
LIQRLLKQNNFEALSHFALNSNLRRHNEAESAEVAADTAKGSSAVAAVTQEGLLGFTGIPDIERRAPLRQICATSGHEVLHLVMPYVTAGGLSGWLGGSATENRDRVM